MQFLVLAQVSEGVSIEQVLPHVKPKQQQFGRNIPLRLRRSIYYIADMSGAVLM